MQREDILSLYNRIERMKEIDPRYSGSMDDIISLYIDLEGEVKRAGWNSWNEYKATLFHTMGW